MDVDFVFDAQGSSLAEFTELAEGAMASEMLCAVERVGAGFHLRLSELPSFDFYVDPLVEPSVAELDQDISTESIRFWLRAGDRWQVSMNDAWTLPAWDSWLDPDDERSIVLLHADDHDDLMPPRIHARPGGWSDAITGESVSFGNGTLASAVRSSAVGMGSFLTVMVHHPRVTELRHLRARPHRFQDRGWLQRTFVPDSLEPIERRLAVAQVSEEGSVRFRRVVEVDDWVRDIEPTSVVLVHIDLDYLSNRYDCDSDWQTRTDLFDPPAAQVRERLQRMLGGLDHIADRVAGVAIGISPGFFPAEYWRETLDVVQAWAVGRSLP